MPRKKTRASYGTGSIQKEPRPDGSMRLRWLYRQDGKRKASPRFKTEDELHAWIAEHRATNGANAKRGTFRDASTFWLAARSARPSKMASYRSTLDGHLLPFFGSSDLSEISTDDLNVYATHKLDGTLDVEPPARKKLARSTVYQHLWIVRSIYNHALHTGSYAGRNPASASQYLKVKKEKEQKTPPRAMGEREQRRLWKVCPPPHRPFLGVLLFVGLRFGEAAALHWSDFASGTIIVKRAVKAEGALENLPKTALSNRSLVLSDEVIDLLKTHYHSQKALGIDVCSQSLIFPAPRAAYLSPRTWGRKFLAPLCIEAGISRFTPHELRHTFAQNQLNAGVDMAHLSRMMGHATAGFTLDQYISLLDRKLPPVRTLDLDRPQGNSRRSR